MGKSCVIGSDFLIFLYVKHWLSITYELRLEFFDKKNQMVLIEKNKEGKRTWMFF
jgi:hypothetical protein